METGTKVEVKMGLTWKPGTFKGWTWIKEARVELEDGRVVLAGPDAWRKV